MARLLAVAGLLEDRRVLLLRLLDGLFWNVTEEEEDAILTGLTLDQPERARDSQSG